MLNTPFAPWPIFTDEEVRAVGEVLSSGRVNYWTGTEARIFEQEFANYVGTSKAIALANGTVALDLALKGLGVGPGDEVIVTPRTFLASVSTVVNAGATPVFADVCPVSGNLTAASIAAALTHKTKAVICVHLAGWPCDMDPIMELSREHGLFVIEDCAQAHGARYRGRSVGSIGHVGAWSFCQDKIMSTGGEGGMVTCSDEELWSRMWSYKDHGKSYEAVYRRDHPPGFRWLHESFGTNWRMTEMQAVLGRLQLAKLDRWSEERARNAAAIRDACRPWKGLIVPNFSCAGARCDPACPLNSLGSGCRHANYKCYVYVDQAWLKPGWSRDRIVEAVVGNGVPCYQGTCSEVYLEKAFDDSSFRPSKALPVAKALGESSLMFLVHPGLTEEQITKTCEAIHFVMSEACVTV